MRNLKRVLAMTLVFALVMSLGLSSFAATGADTYGDWDDVGTEYQDAVMLTAFADGGYYLLQGSNNAFDPKDSLTRAEFATFAARADMGGSFRNGAKVDDATLFAGYVNSNKFSDVSSKEWYAGAVNYCASRGIVNGYNDGTFKPDQEVKPVEVFKMLLVLLGFRSVEMTGSSWEATVYSNMVNNGIDLYSLVYGSGENGAVTREEAAWALSSALNSNTFKGSDLIGYTENKDNSLLKSKFAKNFPVLNDEVNSTTIYGVLVRNKYASIDPLNAGADGDVFLQAIDPDTGLTTGEYYIINSVNDDKAFPTSMIGARIKVDAKQVNKTNIYTYIGKAPELQDTLVNITLNTSDNSKYNNNVSTANNSASPSAITVYTGHNETAVAQSTMNGTVNSNWTAVFGSTAYTEAYGYRTYGKNAYRDNSVFRNTYALGKVNAIDGSTVTVKDVKDGDTLRDKKTFENAAGLAVGDYILYVRNVALGGTSEAYSWKSVTALGGMMTAFNTNGNKATINGAEYSLFGLQINKSGKAAGASSNTDGVLGASSVYGTGNFNTDGIFFLYDGKLIGLVINTVSAPTQYCIVLEASNGSANNVSGTNLAKAYVLKDDGTKATYNVTKVNGIEGKNAVIADFNIPATNSSLALNTKIWKYELNSDGTAITLTDAGALTASTAVTYAKGQTAFNAEAIATGTKWFTCGNGSWNVYTGTGLLSATYGNVAYFKNNNAIAAGIITTASQLVTSSGNLLYVASPINFVTVDGKITAQFRAVNVKTGDDLGTVSLIPGKQADGSTGIGSNDAGIVKGQIMEFEKDGDYYKKTGTANVTPTATSGSIGAPAGSTWHSMFIGNYVNGTFKSYNVDVSVGGAAVTTGSSLVDSFYSTADTVVIDCTGDTFSKKNLSDYSTTVLSAANPTSGNSYLQVLVQVKSGAGGTYEVEKIIVLASKNVS